jgi:hypothetical protein
MSTDYRAELQRLLGAVENDVIDTNDGLRFQAAVNRARAALAQPEPVPVAERPWEREGWRDAEGRCWWFNHAGIPEWQLASDGPYGDFSLPHHALPVPGAEGCETGTHPVGFDHGHRPATRHFTP